jgi:hypothetical protein
MGELRGKQLTFRLARILALRARSKRDHRRCDHAASVDWSERSAAGHSQGYSRWTRGMLVPADFGQ